jgi:protein translocase SecG subunit
VHNTLVAILVAAHLIVSVLLIALILMHSGKDSGMASVTGFSFASQASVAFFATTFLLAWALG